MKDKFDEVRVRFAPSPTGYLHFGSARTALFNWLFAKNKNGKFIVRIEDTDRERSSEESVKSIIDDLKWIGLEPDEGPFTGGDFGPYFQSERIDIYREKALKLMEQGRAYYCFCTQEELGEKRRIAKERNMPDGSGNYILQHKIGKDRKKSGGSGRNISQGQYRYDGKCSDLSKDDIKSRIEKGQSYSIRLRANLKEIEFRDLIHGDLKFNGEEIGDFIIIRSDGFPVYNFAVVVDDALMRISHIIRGDDHISNTPRQMMVYKALDLDIPEFAHIPMILGEDGSRLSKRHGAVSIGYYRENGFLPEALINYLARLGWSYDDKQEIFSIDELKEKFSLESVNKKSAVFNFKKLLWVNSYFMKKKSSREKAGIYLPILIKNGIVKDVDDRFRNWFEKILDISGERIRYYKDLIDYCEFFFNDKVELTGEQFTCFTELERVKKAVCLFREEMLGASEFTEESVKGIIMALPEKLGLEPKEVFKIIRLVITGKTASPGLFESIFLLGRERVLKRIDDALAIL